LVEEIKQEQNVETNVNAGIPVYLVVILGIVSVLLGAFMFSAFFVESCPEPIECEECICEPVINPVEVKLIYDEECDLCIKEHTILLALDEREVIYDLIEVEASSEEGKKLINEFKINSLPSVLINSNQIKSYPAVSRALSSEEFNELNNFFIVPELNFHPAQLRARFFLNPVCSDSNEKIKVILFDSPYWDLSVLFNEEIDSVLREFENEIDFSYYYINSERLKENVSEGNELTAKYLYCADAQGKFLEYENAVKRIYCGYSDVNAVESGSLKSVPYSPDLMKCASPANTHLYYSLSEGELVRAAREAELDISTLEDCAVNFSPSQKPLSSDEFNSLNLKLTLMDDYGKYWSPMVLVGCKYLVSGLQLKQAICELNPELIQCIEESVEEESVEEESVEEEITENNDELIDLEDLSEGE
jgi:hypothetical protein